MHWKIVATGKPSLPWARDGIADYAQRFSRYARLEIEYLREAPRPQLEERMLHASEGCLRIAMDERGRSFTTDTLCQKVDRWELDGTKRIALLIGGADGHSPALRSQCLDIWALSPLTLQHELALVVLLEQIYRVYTIKRGEPYHR
jgi:23S rRNA (pseudouridine1915-N3)-methyltransferase